MTNVTFAIQSGPPQLGEQKVENVLIECSDQLSQRPRPRLAQSKPAAARTRSMLHVFPRARAALVVVSLMLIFLATAPIPALAATKEFALGHHNGPVTSLAFSEDAKFLAAGTEEGNVILWNLEAKRSCYSIFVAKHVNALTFTHDGTLLFTGTHQSLLRWTIASASRFENEMGESHV